MQTSPRSFWPVLLSGLVSLAIGIGIWWPMVSQARCTGMACENRTCCYFLGYILSSMLGVTLLRQAWRLRKEARRRVAGLPEQEPSPMQVCSECSHGHMNPGSVAVVGCWAAVGYLVLALGLLLSLAVADSYLTPLPSDVCYLDGRSGTLYTAALFLFAGWVLTIRTSILRCDHCPHRCLPHTSRPGSGNMVERDGADADDNSTEALRLGRWTEVPCEPEDTGMNPTPDS